MVTYLVRRLLLMLPTLVGITLMVFMLLALAPGGIGAGLQVQGGQMSDTSKVAQMQAYLEDRYGLTDPVIVQYARWIGRISPVKFGQRDLRAPSGDRVPMPRAIDLPSLAGVFAPPPMPRAARVSGFRAPETCNPWRIWKRRMAAVVSAPALPSTAP